MGGLCTDDFSCIGYRLCTHSEQVLSDGCTTWVLEIPCLMCVPFVGLCATVGHVHC